MLRLVVISGICWHICACANDCHALPGKSKEDPLKQSQKYSFLCMLALALVLVLAAGSAPTGVASAAAPDLFFSEYIEGSSNNKALEVYNGTGAPVDLTGYTIEQYSNGSTTVSLRLDL